MTWPELVPAWVCTTKIKVTVENGIKEDGAPKQTVVFEGLCNYSEKERSVLDAERRLVSLEAQALIPGDIAAGKDISGRVVIGDGTVTRRIYRASRARNPDGTVNFTQLELM